MFMKYLLALSAIAVELSLIAAPASALTMAECSAKYNSAKDADTLDGMTWNQFRKAECGADATDEAPAKADKSAAASDDVAAKRLTAKECSTKYNAAKEADSLDGMTWNQFRTAECGPGATIAAAPAKVDKETTTAADDEAKGLTAKECGAKYQAGKDADSLNGMKWNDFRKAECGPGTTAAFVPAKKTKAADADENAGKSLSMKECSAKYQNAKANGSLEGMKWHDFRKNECGANADDDDTVPAFDEATYTDEPETPVAKAPRGVKFPEAVSSKFSDETPAKARMRTCLEQYYVNKDADSLGGLRWIQKGGGYYSLCNARLKSES